MGTTIQGLVSGNDWGALIDGLISAEKLATVTPLENKRTAFQSKLTAWQSFNSTLRNLQTYIETSKLNENNGYDVFSTSLSSAYTDIIPSNVLSVSASSADGPGTFMVEVLQLAEAEKFSSDIFVSKTEALGGGTWTGDILVNGTKVSISDTDSLVDIVGNINGANAGVTASIISVSDIEHHLVIESNDQGKNVLDLQNGSSLDVIADKLKLNAGNGNIYEQFAHTAADGSHYGTTMADNISSIKTLFDLTTGESGNIVIQGQDINIDLSVDSLTDIADRINEKITGAASIESVLNDEGIVTGYRLKLDSSISYDDITDAANIMETLGMVEGKRFNTLSTEGGSDALFQIDGYPITSQTNTVSSAINGVTLTLNETNIGKPVKLTIAYDNAALTSKISALISNTNSVLSNIKTQNSYTTSTTNTTSGVSQGTTGGPLFGDINLVMVQNAIRDAVFSEVDSNTTYKTLSSIGITFTREGTLNVDTAAFATATEKNRGEVENVIRNFSGILSDKTDVYVDPLTGILSSIETGINARITDINQRVAELNARYERKTIMLQQKFNVLESLISRSTTTQSWLTQQIDYMTKINAD